MVHLVLIMLGATVGAAPAHEVELPTSLDLEAIRALPVQHDGRWPPLDTVLPWALLRQPMKPSKEFMYMLPKPDPYSKEHALRLGNSLKQIYLLRSYQIQW